MKKMMTVGVLSIVAFTALILILGLLMPNQREFVKVAELKSSPEKVFAIVADFQNQASWRNDVREIKVINENTWKEIPEKGTPITCRIRHRIENQLFEIEIIEPKSFDGHWVGTFEPTSQNGTKIILKEVITIRNPFFRGLSYIFVELDKTMELYITNLKLKLGEQGDKQENLSS